MEIFKIGIVGQGFVGSAIREGLKNYYKIETYDKYKDEDSTCKNLKELCAKTNMIFICLPTPMSADGSCDLSILSETIHELDKFASLSHIAIIKSTIPPGTTREFNKTCGNLSIIFSPEFLTEANYIEDFKNQSRILLGGPRPAISYVKTMFRKVFRSTPIIKTGSNTAEMVKYTTNCFLATKVSFANEMKQICDRSDVDYDKVIEYALYDERIGPTHLSVPGPDGKLGFGGSCFPKDLNALIKFSQNADIQPLVLKSVWEKNLEVRPEKDWELLKGRAVSKEEK